MSGINASSAVAIPHVHTEDTKTDVIRDNLNVTQHKVVQQKPAENPLQALLKSLLELIKQLTALIEKSKLPTTPTVKTGDTVAQFLDIDSKGTSTRPIKIDEVYGAFGSREAAIAKAQEISAKNGGEPLAIVNKAPSTKGDPATYDVVRLDPPVAPHKADAIRTVGGFSVSDIVDDVRVSPVPQPVGGTTQK